MKTFISTLVVVLIISSGNSQVSNNLIDEENISIGDTFTFYSKVLNEKRKVNIYLPADYSSDSIDRYPVIYLLDGKIDEDFIPIVGLVKFLSSTKTIRNSIIVGIESENRTKDYTSPTQIEKELGGFPPSGNSEKFIEFIKDELLIFIEDKYNVSDERTIIGNTFGGLLIAEILLTASHLFDCYILISPSLWWNNNSILDLDSQNSISNRKVYIAAWSEDLNGRALNEKFLRKLKKESIKSPKEPMSYFSELIAENDNGAINYMAIYKALKRLNIQ